VRRLKAALDQSAKARDLEFLLIDCPPSLGLLTLNALVAAREVIVPMQAHFLALQGVARLLETVGAVFEQVNPTLGVSGIVLCMFEGQTRLAGEVVENLESFFDQYRGQDVPWRHCRVIKPPVRRNIKLAEAPSFGQSIYEYDHSCPGAQDYQKIAVHLMRQWDMLMSRRKRRVDREAGEMPIPHVVRRDAVVVEAVESVDAVVDGSDMERREGVCPRLAAGSDG